MQRNLFPGQNHLPECVPGENDFQINSPVLPLPVDGDSALRKRMPGRQPVQFLREIRLQHNSLRLPFFRSMKTPEACKHLIEPLLRRPQHEMILGTAGVLRIIPVPFLAQGGGAVQNLISIAGRLCLQQHPGHDIMTACFLQRPQHKGETHVSAISTDLLHWKRYPGNPVLPVSSPGKWDHKFVSDPFIVRDGSRWLNFFFGYDYQHAQEGLAVSEDLLHWTKFSHPLLSNGTPGSLDATHAHKASVLKYQGRLYHFYCAVRPWQPGDPANMNGEFRTITVASDCPFDNN